MPELRGEPFGNVDGVAVERFTIAGGTAFTAEILTYGARIASLRLHDGKGDASVAYGFSTLDEYVADARFHGATVGRYANRIAGGRFAIDGTNFELSRNEGAHTLHGGVSGFDRRVWRVLKATQTDGLGQVALEVQSSDGDQGFPGTLTARVRYTATPEGVLRIDYHAETDAATHVNLTNHTYWNLRAGGDVYAQQLRIRASRYTPVDAQLIPTGDVADVSGTPYDFRTAQRPSAQLDHNWVLDTGEASVELSDPYSGRTLTLSTTEPGVQVYSGFAPAIAIETQHFPDTPHHAAFPSTLLRPGETYASHTEYAFTTR